MGILGYYDLFHYPLRADEISICLQSRTAQQELATALISLAASNTIFEYEGFYTLHKDPASIAHRVAGNQRASLQMPVARRSAKRIARFPYVRAVAISGSLSKHFADEKTDIDFFIITTANRLWIARTLLHLFKKISFLTGHQHRYCMNYFIAEDHLEIPEHNIFTAVEIVTLLPMAGAPVLKNFAGQNNWTTDYFPFKAIDPARAQLVPGSWWGRMTEMLFRGRLGLWLDKWLMQVTDRRWKRKTLQRRVNSRGVVMSMLASRHSSKPDPVNFQAKILQRYADKMKTITGRPAVEHPYQP